MNVTIPSLTVPAALLTCALKVSVWSVVGLKGAETLVVVVTVAAGLTVRSGTSSAAGR